MTTLRERKKRQVRAGILEAAEALFRERGFDDTRVMEIVDRVGISEKSFFNYFSSKEALLSELAIDWYRREAARVRSRRSEVRGGPVLERFLDDVRAQLRAIARDREFMRLVFTRAPVLRGGAPDEQRAAMAEGYAANYALLRELFEEAQQRGELRDDLDPQEIAEYYVSILNDTVRRWLTGQWKRPGRLDDRVMRALGVLLDGLRPRPRPSGRT